MTFLIFSLLLALALSAHPACNEEGYTIPTHQDYTYHIAKLAMRPSEEYKTQGIAGDDVYNYAINICGPVACESDSHPGIPAAGCQEEDGKKGRWMLGRMNSMSVNEAAVPEDGFTLLFEDGDYCHHAQHNRSVLIDVVCHNGDAELEWRETSPECMYLFTLKSKYGCPVKKGSSAGTVIIILLVVGVAVYFVGGFLFGKFVQGKEGMAAIPNVEFWKMVLTCGGRLGSPTGGSYGPAGITSQGRGREGFNIYNDDI